MVRFVIVFALATIVVGLTWHYLDKLGLGRLPGDIVLKRKSKTYYIPITTCLIISMLLSAVLWWLGH
jgi:Protein of unknown function (DUF2905)